MVKKRKEKQCLLYYLHPPWLGLLSHSWRLGTLGSHCWTGVGWTQLGSVHLVEAFSKVYCMLCLAGIRVWRCIKASRNWCFWTVVLERIPEGPLDYKEIQPVHPKGDQSWIFIGRTDAEAPILWPPDAKNWLTGKDPDAGKDWRWEKGTTEDEMVGWHHWLNGHEFEKALEMMKDREGWCAAVYRVAKSRTQLSNRPTTTTDHPKALSRFLGTLNN